MKKALVMLAIAAPIVLLCSIGGCARTDATLPPPPAAVETLPNPIKTAKGSVPSAAAKWQRELTRQARVEWGLNAPIATFAAQVQQESAWRPDAVSPAGAIGIAQFMPATATWIAGAYDSLGAGDPSNPIWALRAMTVYDRHLWERVSAVDDCNRAAKMLSSYNGGLGWIPRDEAKARQDGLNPLVWWNAVEDVNSGRGTNFWIENRGYPRRILKTLEPNYVAAGWGRGLCEG